MYFKYCDISSGRNRDSQGMVESKQLKGIYTPAGSLTFSNSGLPDHHSPRPTL